MIWKLQMMKIITNIGNELLRCSQKIIEVYRPKWLEEVITDCDWPEGIIFRLWTLKYCRKREYIDEKLTHDTKFSDSSRGTYLWQSTRGNYLITITPIRSILFVEIFYLWRPTDGATPIISTERPTNVWKTASRYLCLLCVFVHIS